MTIREGHAFQMLSCGECESTWMDSYKLQGYSQLKITDKGKELDA